MGKGIDDRKSTLETLRAFNDWFNINKGTVSHLKYLVQSNELTDTISAELDSCWADINVHEKEFENVQALCRANNVNYRYSEEPLVVMKNMKTEIDDLR